MKRLVLYLLLILLAFTFHTTVFAATYYVFPTGNDSNAGTQGSPWKTIQKAATIAPSGSVVTVAAGTYNERVTITRPQLSFEAQGTVAMQGFAVNANNVSVKGFDISNANGNPGVYVTNATNCDIENNYVHNTSRQGIFLEARPTNPTAVQNCTVKNNRVYQAELVGIEVQGVNNLIENNEVWDTLQYGPLWPNPPSWIDADGFRFFGSGHIFRGNYIHDIPYDATVNRDPHIDCFQTFSGGGDYVSAHDILFEKNTCILPYDGAGLRAKAWQTEAQSYNLVIRNNVIYTNMASLFNDSHDITLINNTFVGTLGDDAQGIHIINTQNFVAKNNIFVDMENGVSQLFNEGGGSTITGSNNCVYKVGGNRHDPGDVNADPLFVNQAGGDYHLKANSPCIDKGVNDGVTDDKDGISRPQGAGYDIGAYEYSSGFGTLLTPTPTPSPTVAAPTPVIKAGDANSDGHVEETDYGIWLSHYGQTVSGGRTVGDFDGDGKVDGVDYSIWLKNYGT